jgi:hypothetical protein
LMPFAYYIPLIGRFDLIHHRFLSVLPGEQTRDRRQNREYSGA